LQQLSNVNKNTLNGTEKNFYIQNATFSNFGISCSKIDIDFSNH